MSNVIDKNYPGLTEVVDMGESAFVFEGNLTINDDVQIDLPGFLIVNGDLRIERDLKSNATIQTEGKFIVNGEVDIKGALYSKGNITIEGNAFLTDEMYTRGKIRVDAAILSKSKIVATDQIQADTIDALSVKSYDYIVSKTIVANSVISPKSIYADHIIAKDIIAGKDIVSEGVIKADRIKAETGTIEGFYVSASIIDTNKLDTVSLSLSTTELEDTLNKGISTYAYKAKLTDKEDVFIQIKTEAVELSDILRVSVNDKAIGYIDSDKEFHLENEALTFDQAIENVIAEQPGGGNDEREFIDTGEERSLV